MTISWDSSLAMGLPDIDEQHREIFRRLDRMLTAMSHHRGRGEVAPLFAFMSTYVVEHFRNEQALMIGRSYPEYDGHRREHEEIVRAFKTLKEDFDRQGNGLLTVLRLSRAVTDLLRNHINVTDRRLAEFIRGAA